MFNTLVLYKCDPAAAWNAYREHDYARLVHDTDTGKLTVQLANDWYDLTEPLPIPTDLPAQRRPYGLLKRG